LLSQGLRENSCVAVRNPSAKPTNIPTKTNNIILGTFVTGWYFSVYLVMLNTAKSNGLSAAAVNSSGDSVTTESVRAEDNSVASVNAPASTLPSSQSLSTPAAPPQLSKVTAFEFMQAWNGLKGTTDIEPYVSVLDQIQPADIPKRMSIMSCQVNFTSTFSLYIVTQAKCTVQM